MTTNGKKNSIYRPDIDGLRAVAVLSVIIYHINHDWLPGGFTGVDIFFVISGFLITKNICDQIEANKFSFKEFYKRRIKRIVPAMFVVTFVTMMASSLLLMPQDALNVSESGLWSFLSAGNIYFWLYGEHGYFASNSAEIPLLHLWSLGVEEQYYLFWPLCLFIFLSGKMTGKRVIVILALILASFLLAESLIEKSQSFAYYMLPTRAGELLFGSLVAVMISAGNRSLVPGRYADIITVIGFIGIAYGLFMIDRDSKFPGYNAIPTTLGTALIIYAGYYNKTFFHNLLSLKPFVWVGLVSYSAYLWHWPILAFFVYSGNKAGYEEGAILFLIIFVIAYLSYRFVEQPIRHKQWSLKRTLLNILLYPFLLVGAVYLGMLASDGYGLRLYTGYYEEFNAYKSSLKKGYQYSYVCQRPQLRSAYLVEAQIKCLLGSGDNKKKILLYGDSNASQFVGMVDEFANYAQFKFVNFEHSSCPPIYGKVSSFVAEQKLSKCNKSRKAVAPYLEEYDVIILAANWTEYFARDKGFKRSLELTLNRHVESGRKVIVIGKVSNLKGYNSDCDRKSLGMPYVRCIDKSPVDQKAIRANKILESLAANNKDVEFFDVTEYFCPDGFCSVKSASGKLNYIDVGHISLSTSRDLGQRILDKDGLPKAFHGLGQRYLSKVKVEDLYLAENLSYQHFKEHGFRPRSSLPGWKVALPLDWAADPFNNSNWRFQLHAWRILDSFISEYKKTNNPKYLIEAFLYAEDWHRAIVKEKIYSNKAWSDMSTGIRSLKLAFLFDKFRAGELLLNPDQQLIIEELVDLHAEKLQQQSFISLYSNHGFFQVAGLSLLCDVAGDRPACAGAQDFAKMNFDKIFANQFTEQGVHKEHSPGYHFFATRILARLESALRFENSSTKEILEQAEEVKQWLVSPDDQIIPIGDSFGSPKPPQEFPVSSRTKIGDFTKSGYASVIKNDSLLFVTGMSNSITHNHADELSFVYYHKGSPVFIDSGKYGYKNDKWREYLLSASAHNTVSLLETAIMPMKKKGQGSFLKGVFEDEGTNVITVTGKIKRKGLFSHKRAISYSPESLLRVRDSLKSDAHNNYVSSLHIAPSLEPILTENGFRLTLQNDEVLTARLKEKDCKLETYRGTERPLLGWISTDYLEVQPASVIRAVCSGKDRTITWKMQIN